MSLSDLLAALLRWPSLADVNDLENTGIKCRSAHIAGGIIEMFYPAWKMKGMNRVNALGARLHR